MQVKQAFIFKSKLNNYMVQRNWKDKTGSN
jgi:hypothetical protein